MKRITLPESFFDSPLWHEARRYSRAEAAIYMMAQTAAEGSADELATAFGWTLDETLRFMEEYKSRKKGKRKTQPRRLFNLTFIAPEYQEAMSVWLEYKKAKRQSYASEKSIETCYKNLLRISNGNPDTARQIVEQSIANNWAGLFPLKQFNYGTTTNRREEKRNSAGRAKQLAFDILGAS